MAIRHFLTGLGLGIALASAYAARERGETRDFAYDGWRRLQVDPVPDEVLATRVRAEIARVAIRPDYLTVLVDRGNVTISGWATPEEFERLIEAVRQVKGVERVQSQLDAFGHPEQVRSPLGGRGPAMG